MTLGSDWPVARYDWREGMAAAQLRRPPGLTDRGPYDDQAIDALTALHGYTSQPRADRRATRTASAASRPASSPTSPCSPRTRSRCAPDDLVHDPVVLTVVGGEVVFRGSTLDG